MGKKLNLDVCPKCGSKRIITNKEINNAWVMCAKCGYYLRKPKKELPTKKAGER
jgi:transcription initiation factor TFIIIB Brf1 subunit/transcription initiation factor TFIIB